MKVREVLIVVAGAVLLIVALFGGLFLLLQTDFSAFRTDPAKIDCTGGSTSDICRLRNFVKAQSETSVESRDCLRYGLPGDCTD